MDIFVAQVRNNLLYKSMYKSRQRQFRFLIK